MAIRIPWDNCEAAYLLFELIRVLNNEIPRNESIQLISNVLRRRAVLRGIAIDDVFRNINGINLQMSIMEYIYTEGKHGLKKPSMPKAFQYVVELYKFDKNKFEQLTKEAIVIPSHKSIEEQFYAWLSTQVRPNTLSDLYTAYREINCFCIERKILKKPLFETVDLSILNNVRMTVECNKVFRFTYKRQLTKMSIGIRQYIAYIKAHPELVESTVSITTGSIQSSNNGEPVREHEVTNDNLIQLLIDRRLKYVDCRNKNGCLWVIGGRDIAPFANECMRYGVIFHYKEDGGRATAGRPAWWTKDFYKVSNDVSAPTTSKASANDELTDSRILILDFKNYSQLSFTKPVAFYYFGEEHSPLVSWKQLYVEVSKCLFKDYPNILPAYMNKNLSGHGRCDFADDSHQAMMTSPKMVADGFYVETNLSAIDIISKIKRILDICLVDYENLEIQYVVKATRSATDEEQKAQNTTPPSAASNTSAKAVRKEFIGWMQKGRISNATILSYLLAIGQCNKIASQLKITENDLYDITNIAELLKIRDRLLSNLLFKKLNDQQHNRFLSAMNKLIAFRQEPIQDLSTSKKISTAVTSSNNSLPLVSNEVRTKYENILSMYFNQDGYQPGRAIFRGRFKRFYSEEYGVEPSESDDNIDGILQLVGTIRDGRIFPKQDVGQNQLVQKIIEAILAAFEDGASVVYIAAVFDRYQSQLAENLQVYSTDALASILIANSDGRFTQKYSYLVKECTNADPASDILRIMRASQLPQKYTEIHKKAWYIPYDKIKTLLVENKSIVNVAPGYYFYAPNLPISPSEVQQLISVIQVELEYKSFITDVELMGLIQAKCPSIAINTEGFTTYGLRNCLGYILRDRFSFKGPIISQLGQEFSMSDVYAEFAQNHEELSLDELKALSTEMNISIYWDSVLEKMVRVSDQKMIRRDLIDFDVDLIDKVLDEMCPAQYIPLKDVNLFLQFPNIGYAWNHFVLESYLFKNSCKFKLLHLSFGQNSVCGAMVRVDSAISDYHTLIVDALSKSNALGSVKAALQYIVECGYQQRRRYDGIEQLIKEAKLIKEKRENEEK